MNQNKYKEDYCLKVQIIELAEILKKLFVIATIVTT